MDYLKARQILEEYAERERLIEPTGNKIINFDKDLFTKQLDFINSSSKRKALLCGRRAGKSYAAAYYLVKTAYETPKAECLYVALTLKSAKKIILPALKEIIERYKIEAEYNYTDYTYTFKNGSSIRIVGADMERMADRLRGQSYNLTVIDEAQAFGEHLNSLVDDVLVPAVRERSGTCCLIGTPDIVCAGLFYEATTNKRTSWNHWHWNLTENRYYKKWANRKNWQQLAQEELQVICQEEGLNNTSERFRREYIGEWVEGGSALVYKYNSDINTFTELPKLTELYHLFGIDFGIVDESAILVAAYSPHSKILWILEEFKQGQLSPEALAKLIKTRYDAFLPVSLVCDGNGIGAAFISQLQAMYELPIELAEKKDKTAFIELLNDDLLSGKIKIHHRCKELIKEIKNLQWADPILKELPDHADDHLLDALLYLWRKSQHFLGIEPKTIPAPTVAEYSNYLRDQELERVKQEQEQSWWEQ